MIGFTLDLGTTNSGVAYWDLDADRPRMLALPRICRFPGEADPLRAPRLIPSAVHVEHRRDLWSRLGRSRLIQPRFFWGRQAYIGREALARNEGWTAPNFAQHFKPALALDPHRVLARARQRTFMARDITHLFMRELLVEVRRETGERPRQLVITTPVDAYDAYRAELSAAARRLGIKRLRFIDEPVAAALGYGLGLNRARRILVVDFGGGTLDLAVVSLSAHDIEAGQARVLAKSGRPVGGRHVDQWIMEAVAAELEVPLDAKEPDAALWHGLMLEEARRVKEAVYFEAEAHFSVTPPPQLHGVRARLGAARRFTAFTQADLRALLTRHGLYGLLDDCLDELAAQLRAQGEDEGSVEEVLMVGGSTLLPEVYAQLGARFGRDRVRAWQPFEAVTFGACAFAADRFGQSDFIVHDYAIVTYDPKTHERQYTSIIPKGTRFPTPMDLWKRQLVPTCALGEPERVFKLVVCEIAHGEAEGLRFGWDAAGQLRRLDGAKAAPVIVPLNEASPGLGHLDPPHLPSDRSPRLEIAFGVDEHRWLCATVVDLKTRRALMKAEPVVRLL
ncbi:Hsp70 family protein [Myxococcota bacterium]|nr:Hsp70 family protein [Myxococcota bacterium]